ncbi:hypothetical protein CK203_061714 [Vitis vinifera]|uniref:Copia protein n=1 Tax=Vitis vinifera TaxID=29760 RepID=A0A438FWV2_VITVI|nr:hypothetical protein CK203_061714 [Vitis vinifera]
MTWLMNSMNEEIGSNYMFYSTTKELWDNGEESVTKYFSLLKLLWIYKFLVGLNVEFDEVRGRIIGRVPLPKISEVFVEVRREESQRHQPVFSEDLEKGHESSAVIVTNHAILKKPIGKSMEYQQISKAACLDREDQNLRKKIGSAKLIDGLYYFDGGESVQPNIECLVYTRRKTHQKSQIQPIPLGNDQSRPLGTKSLNITGSPTSNLLSIPVISSLDLVIAIALRKALDDPNWKVAVMEEMNALKRSVLTDNDKEELDRLKRRLVVEFEIKDLGALKYFLGKEFARSKEAISIAHNLALHDRTKHVEVDNHFIKEKLENRLICMPYIPTTEQVVDVLTKGILTKQFD